MIKNLEKSLAELELIVEQLEKGEKPLSDSLNLFEKGIKLTVQCQESLTKAEQKIQQITQNNQETGNLS